MATRNVKPKGKQITLFKRRNIMKAATKIATKQATRKPAAKPIEAQPATKAPAITEETLKDINQIAHAKPSTPQEGKLAISNDTFIQAINTASMSYKFAFYMEMAVCLAVFAEAGDTGRDAKRSLYQIYQQCGYQCDSISASEYKTVSRRVNAGADLFSWLGKDKIQEWLAGASEMAALNSIVRKLEEHNLRGINSVLALVGKPVQQKIAAPKAEPKASTPSQPAPEIAQKPAEAAATSKVAQMVADEVAKAREDRNRRKADIPGALNFASEHVQVIIGPKATKSELIRISMELLQFAETVAVSEEAVAA